VAQPELSLFLAGDAMITRPWSQVNDPAFLALIDTVRGADAAIVNLETLIHEFEGYAQANSGGTYMASPPEIAGELRWAGFDMLAHANNHTFDYGSTAVLETVEHAEKAGLLIAGSGKDLQTARAPRYLTTPHGTVGLVAMASSFVPFGKASNARPDLHGRPGLNPLTLTSKSAIIVPRSFADRLRVVAGRFGKDRWKLTGSSFIIGGLRFRVGDGFAIESGHRVAEPDLSANLAAIAEAKRNADVVVASIHAHKQGKWLEHFAGQAIERGADVIFVHGPHRVGAVEIRNGKPILYSLGDFVVEVDHITRFPAEAYESARRKEDTSPSELVSDAHEPPAIMRKDRAAHEGVAALLSFVNGKLGRLRLLPVDLQFDAAPESRGRPRIASTELGRKFIGEVTKLSQRYGTKIRFEPEENCGVVELEQSR
jgi:poly-gamma-glutamate capsule biosynthesis protein CapA/YwtB (metallophosphatase superfamily)